MVETRCLFIEKAVLAPVNVFPPFHGHKRIDDPGEVVDKARLVLQVARPGMASRLIGLQAQQYRMQCVLCDVRAQVWIEPNPSETTFRESAQGSQVKLSQAVEASPNTVLHASFVWRSNVDLSPRRRL